MRDTVRATMPSHQERRAPLPKGYQFPTPPHVHTKDGFNPVTLRFLCKCGAVLNTHDAMGRTDRWLYPDWHPEADGVR